MENTGEVLRIIRKANDKKIRKVVEGKNISATFLSEVEKGKKNMSDKKLKVVLEIYNLSENQFLKFILYYNELDAKNFTKLKKYQLTLLEVLKYYCSVDE